MNVTGKPIIILSNIDVYAVLIHITVTLFSINIACIKWDAFLRTGNFFDA